MNKECYKVEDFRQSDAITQEVKMQKKVLAAYKATRARKKVARQKAQEIKESDSCEEKSCGLHMEQIQEGEEALKRDGDNSDDELAQFDSDMSDKDVGETVEVDDPMELLWSAFSQADTESRGLLSIAQTRLGVVNVLGIGTTTSEITEALVRLNVPHPFNVNFDVFADLVTFFRETDNANNQDKQEADQSAPFQKNAVHEQHKSSRAPAGSAAVAIKSRFNLL